MNHDNKCLIFFSGSDQKNWTTWCFVNIYIALCLLHSLLTNLYNTPCPRTYHSKSTCWSLHLSITTIGTSVTVHHPFNDNNTWAAWTHTSLCQTWCSGCCDDPMLQWKNILPSVQRATIELFVTYRNSTESRIFFILHYFLSLKSLWTHLNPAIWCYSLMFIQYWLKAMYGGDICF